MSLLRSYNSCSKWYFCRPWNYVRWSLAHFHHLTPPTYHYPLAAIFNLSLAARLYSLPRKPSQYAIDQPSRLLWSHWLLSQYFLMAFTGSPSTFFQSHIWTCSSELLLNWMLRAKHFWFVWFLQRGCRLCPWWPLRTHACGSEALTWNCSMHRQL